MPTYDNDFQPNRLSSGRPSGRPSGRSAGYQPQNHPPRGSGRSNRPPHTTGSPSSARNSAAYRRRLARRRQAMRRLFGTVVVLIILFTGVLFIWSQRDPIRNAFGSVTSLFGAGSGTKPSDERPAGTTENTDRVQGNETSADISAVDSPYARDGIDFRLVQQTPCFVDDQRAIVLIDAGHGGMDGGAPGLTKNGETVAEAAVVLEIALKLQAVLNQQNIEAYLIRSDDTFFSLYARIARASHLSLDYMSAYQPEMVEDRGFVERMQSQLMVPIEINSDNPTSGGFGFMQGYGMNLEQMRLLDLQRDCVNVVFVSLHCNAHNTDKSLHGMQAYYCHDDFVEQNEAAGLAQQTDPAGNQVYKNRDNERNRRLAQSVYDGVIAKAPQLSDTNAGKPVLEGNYAVLREHGLAGTLLEIGYMSNASDIELLTDDAFQSKVAEGIADGLAEYFQNMLS